MAALSTYIQRFRLTYLPLAHFLAPRISRSWLPTSYWSGPRKVSEFVARDLRAVRTTDCAKRQLS